MKLFIISFVQIIFQSYHEIQYEVSVSQKIYSCYNEPRMKIGKKSFILQNNNNKKLIIGLDNQYHLLQAFFLDTIQVPNVFYLREYQYLKLHLQNEL